MRIAIAGAHRTGKTTLMEELGQCLPSYQQIEEPYHQLEEEGHEFGEMPALEDFELQLERSIDCILDCILDADDDQLFDRCPADIAAYLLTHHDAGDFDLEPWLARMRAAMQRLDLVVYVPIESPDRVHGAGSDDGWRGRVDDEVREILLGDRWGFAVDVIEVAGSPRERAGQVLAHLGRSR